MNEYTSDKLDQRIREALLDEGAIIPETVAEVQRAKARLKKSPVTVPPHLRDAAAFLASSKAAETLEILLKEMEALQDEVEELRQFKAEVDGDGCVPATRVQLLEDVTRERDELKQWLEGKPLPSDWPHVSDRSY